MEPIVNPEIKIDKRTKEYKDSLQGQGAEIPEPEQLSPKYEPTKDESAPLSPSELEIPDGQPCSHPGCLSHISHPCEGCGRIGGIPPKDSLQQPSPKEDVESTTTNGTVDCGVTTTLPTQEVEVVKGCHKCGGREGLVVISPSVSICHPCLDVFALNSVEEEVLPRPKRMKRKARDFSHLACGSMIDGVWVNDFSKCMHCGEGLETNEDGTVRHYRYPTPCEACVYENYTTAIINGKEVEIDPTDPPKIHFEDDKQGNEYTELKDSKGKVY